MLGAWNLGSWQSEGAWSSQQKVSTWLAFKINLDLVRSPHGFDCNVSMVRAISFYRVPVGASGAGAMSRRIGITPYLDMWWAG